MEELEKEIKKQKESKKTIMICGITAFAISIFTAFFLMLSIRDNKELSRNIEAKDSILNLKNYKLNITIKTRDSLNNVLTGIEPYRPLTDAMKFRDSSMLRIPYSVGQVVYLKPDSSKVVIDKIIIKGGKFEHSVGFSVIFKDRTEATVGPQLIY